jgi:peptidoglycan/LPS O-acetylase OafA/YrhL
MQVKLGQGYYNEIAILKVVATLFITWFHFKWTVPPAFAPLFIGGAIGNSFFFFCSGYLLKLKPEIFKGEWVLKKLVRLLPGIWIFCLVVQLTGIEHYSGYNFFYPTPYWFVNAIICYFIVYYLFHKWIDKYKWVTIILVVLTHFIWCVLYIPDSQLVMDEGGVKCWYYYFLFFLYGYYTKNKKINGTKWNIFGTIFFIGLFFVYKTICTPYPQLIAGQCLLIPGLLFGVLYNGIKSSAILVKIPVTTIVKKILIELSNLTLDIYIVQVVLINFFMPHIPFPLNVAVVFILIIFIAFINNRISEKVSKAILQFFPAKI